MVILVIPKNNQQGSRRDYFFERRFCNHFNLRPKTIAAILISSLFLYFLSFLSVAIRLHQLDHKENNLLNEIKPRDRTVVFHSTIDNNNENKNYADAKKNGISKHKTNEYAGAPVIQTKKTRTITDEENIGAKEINQIIKEQETKPKSIRKRDEQKPRIKRPGFQPKPYGYMVSPDIIIEGALDVEDQDLVSFRHDIPDDQFLTAYSEVTNRSLWNEKPLPVRTPKAEELIKTRFPKLRSCSKLPEQWPVDNYPDADPFLPWIHDVFPTNDGKFIQFVAQNRRRCHTGTTEDEEKMLDHTAPQVALFQHVPLKKLEGSPEEPARYRLCSHKDADPESIGTRFICRFKPSGNITFSVFNNDYEWTAFQKRQPVMFHEHGRDNYQIQTSQLLFKCPVPDNLVEIVRTGESVIDDWATLFVDLIPVRTPPRYGPPDEFLVPHYAASVTTSDDVRFDADKEWGEGHVLPKLDDSGRWENIPICKPSLMTYEPQVLKGPKRTMEKKHHLISCLWASSGYATRGNRYAINDGQRRLLEWITFNKMIGFDHFYIYDNSGAFTNQSSLQPIADLFPEDVTVIKWPSQVCNNNPNNVDSVGERSSQYAAESSCRLRFGSHANWIGQFDIDEYLIPMGNFSSLLPLLEKLEDEGKKIINFASWRAWPRRTHINDPEETTFKNNRALCSRSEECFELSVQKNTTMLEAYNCDRQKPGKKSSTMPAEKQIYKADYVKQHFIHYSTITESTNLKADEFIKKFGKVRPFPDPLSRFGDEIDEGLMLHSKAIARQDTAGWKSNCRKGNAGFDQCRIGFPWPEDGSNAISDENGWKYNCYVNPRVDDYWAPKIRARLTEMGLMKSN